MAIQTTFPAIKPTLLLDFAKVKQLDPRITFTRASTGTFYNSAGLLTTAAAGVPRFDFNPITNDSLGLLIEEQRTNLVTYSEQFDNAAWGKVRSSVTANTIVAPDGTLTGDKHIPDTQNSSNHNIQRNNITVTNTQHTVTAYAKQAEYEFLSIGVVDSSLYTKQTRQVFNISTGLVGTKQESGGYTVASASITSVGNGWYRCVLVTSALDANSTTRVEIQGRPDNAAAGAFTGDGTSGIFIWGAQLEAGAFPTSYIQTVASQVTRAADAAIMTGTNFSSWYNQGEGTLYGEYIGVANISGATRRLAEIGITTETNNRFVFGYSQTTNTRFLTVVNGATQSDIAVSATQGSPVKFAGAYATNNFQQATNGLLGTADTSVVIPLGINAMAIGSDFGPTANTAINGTIRKIAYYPIRCTNAQLVALTS
jgi:hypothetical protein